MPRLGKGELAAGVRLRSEAAASSAQARFTLMLVLQSRKVVSDLEAAPFTSFEALCKYEDKSKGIFPISPKTLRRHIATDFAGGGEAFGAVMKWLGKASQQSPGDMQAKNKTTSAEKAQQSDAVLEMSARYADLIQRVATLAMESPRARIEFQAHLKVFPESAGHLKLVK